MLKLNVFGAFFGQVDASPFCIKAILLLKMADLKFEVSKINYNKAPKRKAPYL
jgi:hypothetical protein